jgi:O-antigen/teichoic acid export membrane protein
MIIRQLAGQSLMAVAIRVLSVGLAYSFFVSAARLYDAQLFGSISFLVIAPLIMVEFATGGYLLLSQKNVPALHARTSNAELSRVCSFYAQRTLIFSVLFGMGLTLIDGLSQLFGRLLFTPLECLSLVTATVLLSQIWLMSQILRGIGRLQWALICSQFLWRLGLLALGALLFVFDLKVPLALIGGFQLILGANLALMTLLLRRCGIRVSWRGGRVQKDAPDLLFFALAQALAIAMGQLDIFIGRAVLEGPDYSHYIAANRVATLLPFFLQVAMMIVSPHVARLYADRDERQLQRVLTFGALLSFVPAFCIALVALIGSDSLFALFGRGFGDARAIFVVLVIGQLINCGSGLVSLALNQTGLHRHYVYLQSALFLLALPAAAGAAATWGSLGLATAMAAVFFLWNLLAHFLLRSRRGLDSSVLSALPLALQSFGAWRARSVSRSPF